MRGSRRRSSTCGGPFEVEAKSARVAELEQRMHSPEFWSNPDQANQTIAELRELNAALKPIGALVSQTSDLCALFELAGEEGGDQLLPEVQSAVEQLARAVHQAEFAAMMTDKLDPSSAFVSIHAGAGGTESCDWAKMLLRMYSRWADEHGYEQEIIDLNPGEVTGIRNATLAIRGRHVYGHLRSEAGVHRLVRISPFDAQSRRHTSFASVDVMPELDDDIDIEVKESDIEMETFMSGGPGGQHQNKTASGVRLRHLPTGVVVECRNERSQHKNRRMAMKLLKAKLYRIEQEKRDAELARLYDEKGDIAFGSQIRSYVLHPYRLVKDHRTDLEVGDAQSVLEGNLDPFIDAYLRAKIGKKD
jgi:peptide chain release factor 2